MSNLSKIIISMLLVIVIALSFSGGFLWGRSTESLAPADLGIVREAWDYILADYVDPARLSTVNITSASIEGIIAALHDPYTYYVSPANYEIVKSRFEGEFEGIGAVVSEIDGKIVIVALISGAPAEAAGIKSGDIIMAINGEAVEGMSMDVAVSKIRGPSGTAVKLLILHEGDTEPVVIEVTRAKVEVRSVDFEMRGDIAYIIISQFDLNTEDELAQVMPKLAEENAQGIVLDLRGNIGGVLDIVVEVASHFITEGVIVSVRSNQGEIAVHKAVSQRVTTGLPMVVLVDNLSASGGEVLAGALQDYERALIAGNVTYGKGSVNILRKLSDGSGLYITIARWLTPDDRLIEGNGIVPDVKLDLTGDDAVQWAIDYLHGLKSP
jgi:carboxyl-terminal processing protease